MKTGATKNAHTRGDSSRARAGCRCCCPALKTCRELLALFQATGQGDRLTPVGRQSPGSRYGQGAPGAESGSGLRISCGNTREGG